MNWEMVSAIVAVLAFFLTFFVEWPRFKVRLTESTTGTDYIGWVLILLGCLLMLPFSIGWLLALVFPQFRIVHNEPFITFFFVGILLDGISSILLFLPDYLELRPKNWTQKRRSLVNGFSSRLLSRPLVFELDRGQIT
jgi:hypothetical protein